MPKIIKSDICQPRQRSDALTEKRNLKMARSIHAYVRGNTAKYYDWLKAAEISSIPQGPAVWICGDCHTGNLGPVANVEGQIEIEIRDLDQTVIGNPVNDLIRLGLSLATALRSSDLPGVVTAQMVEALYAGYVHALENEGQPTDLVNRPRAVHGVMQQAYKRTWKSLAKERLQGLEPKIELGSKFWPLLKKEHKAIEQLFRQEHVSDLVMMIGQRSEADRIHMLDAAYWVKGCSSLGLLRYIVLMDTNHHHISEGSDLCLMDLKEAARALAPRYTEASMPRDNAERIVEGARHLSPYLGSRMRASQFLDTSVFIRELMPQDLKLEIEGTNQFEARNLAFYLAFVVGRAHVRQMTQVERKSWIKELKRAQSKTIDVPFWLWRSIVELISEHEAGYLEHCRRYALRNQLQSRG